jgi:hypothetical protein
MFMAAGVLHGNAPKTEAAQNYDRPDPPIAGTISDQLEPVHQYRERRAIRREAGPVERAVWRLFVAEEPENESATQQAQRHVDEEYPMPGDVSCNEAAQWWANNERAKTRPTDQSYRAHEAFLRGLSKDLHSPDRRHHSAGDSLKDACQHELREVTAQTTQDRRGSEDADRHAEDISRSEPVCRPAADRNEDCDGDQIGSDAAKRAAGLVPKARAISGTAGAINRVQTYFPFVLGE